MKRKNQVIPADKQVRKNWLILIALYLLILLWLEPVIDFFLMQLPLEPTHEAIQALNQKKAYVSTIAFGVMRSLPILTFVWFGLVIVQAQRLPPKGVRLPITVVLLEGPRARMIGMIMVAVGLLLLMREISLMVGAQPAL